VRLALLGPVLHGEDWLDFNMIETWTEWAKIHPAVISDSLRAPRKPVVLGEGPTRTVPSTPGTDHSLVVRRQAWWTVMAGGFHTYGQNQMWRMEPGWTRRSTPPARPRSA